MIPPGAKAAVVIVSMHGCPACENYVPRVETLAGAYRRAGLPVIYLDALDQQPAAQAWMDRYKVMHTPTTLVLRSANLGGGVWRMEGSQDDATIKQMLDFAYSLTIGRW